MSGISLIVTSKDDREELGRLLEGLSAQTRPPEEIVVADAGSTDGSQELLAGWDPGPAELRVLDARGTNISQGRNLAIRAARHDWLACTDAGCRPVPGWLDAIDRARAGAEFVAGIYVVEGETDLERALALALYPSPAETGGTGALTALSHRLFGRRYEVTHATGRSMAFSRRAWEAAGGFPENVLAGEDVAFSSRIVELGFPAVLVPEAAVVWRPRPTWATNARMYRVYGRGDAEMGRAGRHMLRGAMWGACLAGLAVGGPPRAAAAGVLGAYLALPFARARRTGFPLRAWWRIPAAAAMKDFSLIAGALSAAGGARRAA